MNQDTMTVKELAEVAGVAPRTVRRAVQSLNFVMQSGVESRFDAAQCVRIIGSLRIKGSRNVQAGQNVQQRGQNVQPEIIKAFTDALQVMSKMADACMAMASEVKASRHVIAAPEQEYSTVAGYCRRHGIPTDRDIAQRFGKIAVALSGEMGYPIRKVSDERWGEVNAYHTRVLAQAVRQ